MLNKTEQRVYDRLVDAAEAGEPCPTNTLISAELGNVYPEWVGKCVKRLVAECMITIEQADVRHRRVTITASGARTDWTLYETHPGGNTPLVITERCPREWPADYSGHNVDTHALGKCITPPTFVPRGE